MKLLPMHQAALISAFCAAAIAGPAAAADTYTISSQSTSYSVPSGWPNVSIVYATAPGGVGYAPSDVSFSSATPILICTSARHYNWDSANCGDPGNPSRAYGIGDSNPTIAIGVMFPAPGETYTSVQLTHGDDGTCQQFDNKSQVTNWWEYQIEQPDPNAGAYTFTATVSFQTNKSGQYYAVLNNCKLTNGSTAASQK